jgi:hypothetical protein
VLCVCNIQEREGSDELFKGKKGSQLARDIGKRVKTFVPGAPINDNTQAGVPAVTASTTAAAKQSIEAIKVCVLPLTELTQEC